MNLSPNKLGIAKFTNQLLKKKLVQIIKILRFDP